MNEQQFCPCCGRHCDLNDPCCERGVEYRQTGVIPEKRRGEDHPGGRHRRVPYRALDTNDKLVDGLRDLGWLMRTQYEGKASQKRILMILNSAGPMTQRDLTEYLAIQPGSASEILSKLEHAGLILRTQNEADRRTTVIQLTDAGTSLGQEAADQRHRRHQEMFSCLSDEEKQTLLVLLEKLRDDWRAQYGIHGGHHGHKGDRRGHYGPHSENAHQERG